MHSTAPKPQAPIRSRQTRKVANAKVRNRQMIGRPIIELFVYLGRGKSDHSRRMGGGVWWPVASVDQRHRSSRSGPCGCAKRRGQTRRSSPGARPTPQMGELLKKLVSQLKIITILLLWLKYQTSYFDPFSWMFISLKYLTLFHGTVSSLKFPVLFLNRFLKKVN